MSEGKKIDILEVNSLFMFAAILLVSLGTIFQRENIWVGSILTEVLLILVPSLIYIGLKKESYKEVLKLNKICFKDMLLVVLITFMIYPIATLIQGVFVTIINYIKPINLNQIPLPNDIYSLLRGLIIVGLIPGICEEVMFRGIILNGYRGLGYKKSVIISSIYFGMMHFTIGNLVGPIILGIFFGIMVYKTNSIYSAIIGHIINNSIAMFFGYYLEVGNDNLYNALDYLSNVRVEMYILLIGILVFMIIKLMGKLGPCDNIHISEDEPIIDYNEGGYGAFAYFSPIIVVTFIYIYINLIYVFI